MFKTKNLITKLLIIITLNLLVSCGGGDNDNGIEDPGYFSYYYIKNNSSYELIIIAYDNNDLQLKEKIISINSKVQISSFGELGGGIHVEPTNALNKLVILIKLNGVNKIVYESNYLIMSNIEIDKSNKQWIHEDTGNNYSLNLVLSITDTNLNI